MNAEARKRGKIILIRCSLCIVLSWCGAFVCAVRCAVDCWRTLLDNGIKELSHTVFRDKNEENDEELTKWTNGCAFMSGMGGGWPTSNRQKMYTHFFPRLFLPTKMGKQLLIKHCVISFTDKFPKCQTREDKMIFNWNIGVQKEKWRPETTTTNKTTKRNETRRWEKQKQPKEAEKKLQTEIGI